MPEHKTDEKQKAKASVVVEVAGFRSDPGSPTGSAWSSCSGYRPVNRKKATA
ncbi:MAG: hypothetical protein PHV51_00275 [Methanosarcinaceae archaeon]|nr:hypothetical protein [Methanosarcinaceae archaeon]